MRRLITITMMVMIAAGAWAAGQEEAAASTDQPTVIRWFTRMPGVENRLMESQDEIVAYQMAQEILGIDVEFIHPSEADVELSLLIASGDFPDLITSRWGGYSGGIQKAFDDEVILDLRPYIEDGRTPNFEKWLESVPRLKRDVLSDTGEILAFRRYEPGAIERPFVGFMIRQDWLDAVDMDKPETIDEWHDVLVAFREAGLTDGAPFIGKQGYNFLRFASAWGVLSRYDFQIDPRTGEVVYGKASDSYRDFLGTMLDWLDEGIIDTESLITDEATMKTQFVTGTGGAMWHFVNRFVGFGDPARAQDPNVELVAVGYPVGPAGKPYSGWNFDYVTTISEQTSIAFDSEAVDAALKWSDYWFSQEGALMANWGVEGKSYVEQDGVRSYIVPQDEVHLWAKGDYGTARFVDVQAAFANYTPQQRVETEAWVEADPDYSLHLPETISFTTTESRRIAQLQGDIQTFTAEMELQILLGEKDLSEWDPYVQQLGRMGLEELTAIYQAAMDRYSSRM